MLKELQLFRDKNENECYLVTGAGGFLGSAIVRELIENHKSVHALFLSGEAHTFPPEVKIYYGDVRVIESMDDFFTTEGCSRVIVIHCAAIVSIKNGFDQNVMDVNVGGTKNVVAKCIEKRVDKLVYVSSVHAIPELPEQKTMSEIKYFSPKQVRGIYAKSKALATQYVLSESKKRNLDVSVVHPSGMLGPHADNSQYLMNMIRSYCKGRMRIAVKGGYDFVDVRDVVDGIIACANFGKTRRCYILSGHYMTLQEMFEQLEPIAGVKAPRIYLPGGVAKLFAPAALLYAKIRKQSPFYTSYSIYVLGTNARFTHRRATKELGYGVRGMYNTLRDTVAWMENT